MTTTAIDLSTCSSADLAALTELLVCHDAATVACARARGDLRAFNPPSPWSVAEGARYRALHAAWVAAKSGRNRAAAALAMWTHLVRSRTSHVTITATVARYKALECEWLAASRDARTSLKLEGVYDELYRHWYAMSDDEKSVVDRAGDAQRARRAQLALGACAHDLVDAGLVDPEATSRVYDRLAATATRLAAAGTTDPAQPMASAPAADTTPSGSDVTFDGTGVLFGRPVG